MRKVISNTTILNIINLKLIESNYRDIMLSHEEKMSFPEDLNFYPASRLCPERWYKSHNSQTWYRYKGVVGDIVKHKDNLKYLNLKFHFLSDYVNGVVTNTLFDLDDQTVFSLEESKAELRITFKNETYTLYKLPCNMIVLLFSNQKFYHDAFYNLQKDGQRDLMVQGIKGSIKTGNKKSKIRHEKV